MSTLIKTEFTFRAVETASPRGQALVTSAQAAGIELIEGATDKGAATVCRPAESHDLKVYAVDEWLATDKGAAYVADMLAKQVEQAARSVYIDNMLSYEELTINDIIEANSPKVRESALTKDALTEVIEQVKQQMQAALINPDLQKVVLNLMAKRFSAASLTPFIDKLEGIENVVQRLEHDYLPNCASGHAGKAGKMFRSAFTSFTESLLNQADSFDLSAF